MWNTRFALLRDMLPEDKQKLMFHWQVNSDFAISTWFQYFINCYFIVVVIVIILFYYYCYYSGGCWGSHGYGKVLENG